MNEPSTRPSSGHQPALDGLRGLCLLAVLLFHCDLAWASGGFLGVSTFFTLSGFLITSILWRSAERGEPVSLSAFWGRRSRRLLPAALLTITVVSATSPLWISAAGRERLTGDALASVFYLVNWRFVQAEYAYELIFVDPSPFQHFWSLAIEGQFYLIYPVLFALLRPWAGNRLALALVLLAAAAASVAASVGFTLAGAETYRVYYGSGTRAAEILVGGLIALGHGYLVGPRPSRIVEWFGLAALVAIVAIWGTSRVEDAWLYLGGLAGYSLLSGLVLLACIAPGGPVRRLLAHRSLRWVGEVSYGAYLFHWPVFILLSRERTGLEPAALITLRLAATLALAWLSYRTFEAPIRRGRSLRPPWFSRAMVLAGIAAALAAAIASPLPLAQQLRLAVSDLSGENDEPEEAQATDALRYALFGDSTVQSLGVGIGPWMREREDMKLVRGAATLGRGLPIYGIFQSPRGVWMEVPPESPSLLERWQKLARRRRVDVAIVMVGAWEARNWILHESGKVQALGDPAFDAVVRRGVGEAIDLLAEAGASVVWLTAPPLPPIQPLLAPEVPASRAARLPIGRIARLNQIIHEVAATRPGKVEVIELDEFIRVWPGGVFDDWLRPDGTHFSSQGAIRVVEEYVGPQLEALR